MSPARGNQLCFFKGRRCELRTAEVRRPHGNTVKRTRNCPDLNRAAEPFAFSLLASPAPRRCEATGRGPVCLGHSRTFGS